GLVWVVACAEGKELGRSPMMLGVNPAWTPIEFRFTVPDGDCRAQSIRLLHDSRSASEQLVTGRSYHDDIRIVRIDTP
ncbi:MAG: hypothetical protein NW223_11930, partial [Hyphomicrobiaceae bacterium]|nr:hypothetical protein [Hyphomicrobiaceae bacterium]